MSLSANTEKDVPASYSLRRPSRAACCLLRAVPNIATLTTSIGPALGK